MKKTYTPELTPEALDRLRDYAELFRDDFRYKTQHAWSGVYLRGLLQDGERKSIEPMMARVPRPAELLDIQDPEQAMQQFVNQSPLGRATRRPTLSCRDGATPGQSSGDLYHRRYRLPQTG